MEKRQRILNKSTNQKGYMLIEALIAIAIFSIGFLAVATMVFSATRNNTRGNILTQANMLARQQLEQLKNTPDITTLPSDPTTTTESGIEANGDPGGIYTRTTTIEDTLKFNTSRAVEVTVNWTWRGQSRSIVLNTITKGNGT
ncbi:MAG: prepilin-type N-terminal cleavage/methylation domain-containing protein [Desulfobacterales bacterium]|jgi:Tfp pilus assembly protein PilV|nr:prepilin-type N-terminal cleavage/methylation domain-containing protein [Desulfobacterales bacterium]